MDIAQEKFVEIARVLFHVLKQQIVVHRWILPPSVDDQFLGMILTEFLSTYIVRHKGNIEIDFTKCFGVTIHGLAKLIETVSAASGGFGSIRIRSKFLGDEIVSKISSAVGNVQYPPQPYVPGASSSFYLG
jgi:hypothetical protein